VLLDLHDHIIETKIINSNIFYKEELESTNKEARKFISNYGIIACDKQTHGRGRHGRKWISTPYKDLAFTIIIPNDCNINGQNLVDLACESIVFNLQKLKIHSKIKYPNDIYVKNRKIAGVLCEQIVKDTITAPIIGIGINVNSNLEDLKLVQDKLYTSLFIELGKKTNRENLLKNIVEKIDDTIQKQEYQ